MSLKLKPGYVLAFLVFFHTVGIVLMTKDIQNANLSWLNLSLCGLAVVLTSSDKLKVLIYGLLISFLGFSVEYIGVHTQLLFGEYWYGEPFGIKINEVPPLIGLNWFVIVYCSVDVATRIGLKGLFAVLVAGLLALGMDYLMEPIAMKLNFWDWKGGEIPLFNYICWFGFALIFSWILINRKVKTNVVGTGLYFIWAAFFVSLHILL